MAKDIEEKIGAMSQKNCHGLKYKYPLKNYRVHEMPTGDQLPPHYLSSKLCLTFCLCTLTLHEHSYTHATHYTHTQTLTT